MVLTNFIDIISIKTSTQFLVEVFLKPHENETNPEYKFYSYSFSANQPDIM